nr:basic salivary proline-rich protein 2-like [Anas platyrhynchos]
MPACFSDRERDSLAEARKRCPRRRAGPPSRRCCHAAPRQSPPGPARPDPSRFSPPRRVPTRVRQRAGTRRAAGRAARLHGDVARRGTCSHTHRRGGGGAPSPDTPLTAPPTLREFAVPAGETAPGQGKRKLAPERSDVQRQDSTGRVPRQGQVSRAHSRQLHPSPRRPHRPLSPPPAPAPAPGKHREPPAGRAGSEPRSGGQGRRGQADGKSQFLPHITNKVGTGRALRGRGRAWGPSPVAPPHACAPGAPSHGGARTRVGSAPRSRGGGGWRGARCCGSGASRPRVHRRARTLSHTGTPCHARTPRATHAPPLPTRGVPRSDGCPRTPKPACPTGASRPDTQRGGLTRALSHPHSCPHPPRPEPPRPAHAGRAPALPRAASPRGVPTRPRGARPRGTFPVAFLAAPCGASCTAPLGNSPCSFPPAGGTPAAGSPPPSGPPPRGPSRLRFSPGRPRQRRALGGRDVRAAGASRGKASSARGAGRGSG